MTLWELSKGNEAIVNNLYPQLDVSIAVRLSEMGFEENQPIKCLRRSPFSGPIVVQLGDCVYSLEQQLAQQIFISIN